MVGKEPPTSFPSRETLLMHPIPVLLVISACASLLLSSACAHGDHQSAEPILEPPFPVSAPLSSSLINVSHGCLDSERSALLQFKAGLNDPNNRLSSWRGFDCCRWSGVACDRSTTGAVVKVDLRSPYTPNPYDPGFSASMYALWNLSGRIDPSLLHLESLRHLDLSGNNFDGIRIPAFFGSFKELRYLNLSQAGFMGSIPPQLGNLTRLQYLDLSSGWWSPSFLRADGFLWISGLSSLRHLAMNNINLSAVGSNWIRQLNERLPSLVELHLSSCQLPSMAASLPCVNFTSLEVIDLSENFMSASSTILSWLPNVTSLVHVDISVCNLSGPIPVHFSKLPNLEYLDLSANPILTADVAELLGHGGWPSINTLDIVNNGLYGEIPASIGNLTSLELLDLSSNNIGGGIPASFGRLCKLRELTLSVNNLTGHLPEFLEPNEKCNCGGHRPSPLPRLEKLNLSTNSLVGKLPAWVFERTGLQVLSVSRNQFTGVVTEAHLSELKNLRVLGLHHNSLTLNISPDWIPPFQLEELYVASCQLGPKFPSWIKTQRELTTLDLSKTGISDEVPSWFWDLSTKINGILNISFNCISGQVPSTWSPSPRAIFVDMSSNMLHGRLPTLTLPWGLRSLDLSANRFYGPIWSNIGEMMPTISYLSLAGNYLSGEIPAAIGEMPFLEVLDLSKNNLTGEIPAAIGEIHFLVMLDLSKNNLTGGIPTTLVNCSYLSFLNLGSNNLTGAIPTSLGGLKFLEILQLNNNLLSGEIPLFIRDCSALQILDVRSNTLHGHIPTWIGNLKNLRVLCLRSNRFSGEIPWKLSNLTLLQVLDAAENNLTGPIPGKLGSLRAMKYAEKLYSPTDRGSFYYKISLDVHTKGQDLVYDLKTEFLVTSIDLSGNKLSGEFPESLVNLSSIVSMDLSRNLLIGTIPDTIGYMRQLQSLDLSCNHFSGKIPPSMASLTFLSFLNLSSNNFSGQIPTGGQLETFGNASFLGNPYLCGPLLQSHCPNEVPDKVYINKYAETCANDDLYMGLGFGFAFGILALCIILLVKKNWSAAYFEAVDRIVDKLF